MLFRPAWRFKGDKKRGPAPRPFSRWFATLKSDAKGDAHGPSRSTGSTDRAAGRGPGPTKSVIALGLRQIILDR